MRWSTLCLKTWPAQGSPQFPHACGRQVDHTGPCQCACGAPKPAEEPKPYKYVPGQRSDDE